MPSGDMKNFDNTIDKILHAYDLMSRTINPRPMLRLDLTSAQIKVLLGFNPAGGCSMTDLSKVNAVTVSTMTSMVVRLVQLELVERFYDKQDRRKVLVRLTKNGKKVIDQIMSVRRRELESFLSGLNAREVDEFVSSIEKTAHFLTRAKKNLPVYTAISK